MPNGHGGYGGFERGGGRAYRSNYQYQQPQAFQYESFFDPIPLDFLERQLGKKQEQYDTAYSGVLQAKEAAIQQEVAIGDVQDQMNLVSKSMKDLDTIAEQYGGNWARAAKDAAKEITNLRMNPFWKTSKHLSEQQTIQQKWELEHPNSHIYQNVMDQTTIDPDTGRVRTPEELTFEGQERGDYAKAGEQVVGEIVGDSGTGGLNIAGYGYLSYTDALNLTKDDIDVMLEENPEMIKTFLELVPDYKESRMRLQEGMTEGKVDDEARDFLAGLAYQKIRSQSQTKFVQDWQAKQAATTPPVGTGFVSSNIAEATDRPFYSTDQSAADVEYGEKADIEKMFLTYDELRKKYDKYGGKAKQRVRSNAKRKATKALMNGMEDFVKDVSVQAENLNTITGELGTEKRGTSPGYINKQATEGWRRSKTAYVSPYTGQQIGTLLETDKKYTKPRKTLTGKVRDSSKDELTMTSGTMNGKYVFQLNIYDEDGGYLGSEYVAPSDDRSAIDNAITSAEQMMTSGDRGQMNIGNELYSNLYYGIPIQKAQIHRKPKGMLGLKHDNKKVGYEKIPGTTPMYQVYVMSNGKKEYFEDEFGNPRLSSTEKDIQKLLMAADRKLRREQNTQ